MVLKHKKICSTLRDNERNTHLNHKCDPFSPKSSTVTRGQWNRTRTAGQYTQRRPFQERCWQYPPELLMHGPSDPAIPRCPYDTLAKIQNDRREDTLSAEDLKRGATMPTGRDPAERAALTRTRQVHKSAAWHAVALKVGQEGKGQGHGEPPHHVLMLGLILAVPCDPHHTALGNDDAVPRRRCRDAAGPLGTPPGAVDSIVPLGVPSLGRASPAPRRLGIACVPWGWHHSVSPGCALYKKVWA